MFYAIFVVVVVDCCYCSMESYVLSARGGGQQIIPSGHKASISKVFSGFMTFN